MKFTFNLLLWTINYFKWRTRITELNALDFISKQYRVIFLEKNNEFLKVLTYCWFFFSPPFFSFLCICTINLEYIIVYCVVFCFNDRDSNKNKVKHKTLGPHWLIHHARKTLPWGNPVRWSQFPHVKQMSTNTNFFIPLSLSLRLVCPHFVNLSFSSFVWAVLR